MKAIVCEMCSSRDVVKQDGFYVCQSCGTKYSTEDAKKLMIEISGTVTVDNTKKIENYYQLARRARESSNNEDAAKYYDLIRQEMPDDWEAAFFAVYYSCMQSNIASIPIAASKIGDSAVQAIRLVNNQKTDIQAETAVPQITQAVITAALTMRAATTEHYNKFSGTGASGVLEDRTARIKAIINMLFQVGDAIETLFPNSESLCKNAACSCWKTGIETFEYGLYPVNKDVYYNKVKKYSPSYIPPAEPKKSGCYVATAVYGSYDCPQVWTLRRYRDDTLATTWYGRAFIHTYYAISPTLVKWFGDATWFKNMWKPKLDRMVMRLNQEGVESTPYQDKNW